MFFNLGSQTLTVFLTERPSVIEKSADELENTRIHTEEIIKQKCVITFKNNSRILSYRNDQKCFTRIDRDL